MPTKKRGKGGQSSAGKRRAKPAARATARKPAARARRGRAAGVRTTAAPARERGGKRVVPAGGRIAAEREIARLKARLQREKGSLEKRLTEAVREIGQLRHHEARTAQLERQIQERDQIIGQLRSEVATLRSRSHERARDADEGQRSLSFGPGGTAANEEVGSGSGFYDGDDEPV